jgi:hypothetical protein
VFIEIADKTSDKEAKKREKEKPEEFKNRPRPANVHITPGHNCYIPLEDQLYDDEKLALQEAKKFESSKYFSDEFIMAVLFSRKFDMKRTEEFLTNSLNWRKEKGYLQLPRFAKLDKRLFEIANYYTCSRDNEGRSVRYVRLSKTTPNQNGQTVENLTDYAIWIAYVGIFSEGIDALRNGVCIIADTEGYSWKQFDIDFQKQTHELWLERFPLLMRKMLVINPPTIINAMFKIMSTWTKNKILQRIESVSRKDIVKYVPADQCPEEFGGKAKFTSKDWLKNLEEWAEKCEERLISPGMN